MNMEYTADSLTLDESHENDVHISSAECIEYTLGLS